MILSEGFWACLGVLIGAIIGGAFSLLISKQSLNIELKKFRLPILLDRLKILELIITQYDVNYYDEMDADIAIRISKDYNYLSKKFRHLNHYFIDSNLYPVIKETYETISFELEQEIKEEQTNQLLIFSQKDFNCNMNKLLTDELNDIEKEIREICNYNKKK